MKLIERKSYLDRLLGLRGTPDIKIITGMRRSGKSELIKAFIQRVKERESGINVIFINYADLLCEPLKEYHALHDYVEGHASKENENLLVIDEVQLCPQFEIAVNSLYERHKYDIYLTGSNAFLLSSDLATLFTGRHIEIPVYPFSFAEFCAYWPTFGSRDEAFDEYVRVGGLAGSYLYTDDQQRAQYLAEVFTTILKRDLVEKYNLTNEVALSKLSEFLMDNIGNLTSTRKVSDELVRNHVETSHVTVGKYIDYLCKAFLFKQVKRYDVRGKTYLAMSEKYYLYDAGLRFAILGTRNLDYGHVYENLVYLELLRRGYEVYVGKLYQKEIDFVALRGSEKLYIQVSDNISDEKTREREFDPLKRINDAYPKMLIARTRHPAYDVDGITVVDIASWMTGEKGPRSVAERILERTANRLSHAFLETVPDSGCGVVEFDYGANSGRFEFRGLGTTFKTMWSSCAKNAVYAYRDYVRLIGFLPGMHELPSSQESFDAFDFTHRDVKLTEGDVGVFLNGDNRFLGVKILAVKCRDRGDDCDVVKIQYRIYP